MTDQENLLLDDSDQVNFKDILTKYLKYWYLFLLVTILCLGAAYLYLRYATPHYWIGSTILIKNDQQSGGAHSKCCVQ